MQDIPTGHLDGFSYDAEQRVLCIAGWLLFPDGGPDEFDYRLPGGDPVAMPRVTRPDLQEAFPHIPGADRGGFQVRIPIPGLEVGETIEVAMLLYRDRRIVAEVPVGYRRSDEDYPVPEPEFIKRVANSCDTDYFLATGNRHANDVVRMLRRYRDPGDVGAFLDWGCGCGRVTRHLAGMMPRAAVHGTDIDAEAIEWLTTAMPAGEFHATGLGPPLPYDANKFDLILASSVFTHLTESYQQEWLQEVHRVLAPGGILMATTHGRYAALWTNDPRVDAGLAARGFFDDRPDGILGEVASGDYYRATFQTSEYTRTHWCPPFAELGMVQAGLNFHQDMWILEKAEA